MSTHQDMGIEEFEQLQRAYQRVFKGHSGPEDGQLVLIDILSNICRVFAVNPHTNAQVYKTESKREVGLIIMYMVDMAPQLAGLPDSPAFRTISESLNIAHKRKESARTRQQQRMAKEEDDL
jgi:hypothetical protein